MLDWASLIAEKQADRQKSLVTTVDGYQSVVTETNTQPIDYKQDTFSVTKIPGFISEKQYVCADTVQAHISAPGGGGVRQESAMGIHPAKSISRPVLHYRLHDASNAMGSVIGELGDTLDDLLSDLRSRYGDRLDEESVREAFEERAAIMEFEAGMNRPEAEHAALADVARVSSKIAEAPEGAPVARVRRAASAQ